MAKSSLAVIPARGGSKRIPYKNIRDFLGRPIIEYSISAAQEAKVFDEIMVSTDDEEIKRISETCGASVPFLRSDQNSTDTAMTHEVILEVIAEYKNRGKEFDSICCIYPTAPFITSDILRDCKSILYSDDVDSVIPVVSYSFPPQRAFIIRNDRVEFVMPENRLVRSQDLERWYHDCGLFYFFKTKQFLLEKNLVMKKTFPFIMNESEVQDIDDFEDWQLAEIKMKKILERRGLL